MTPDLDQLLQCLDYNSLTGEFFWKKKVGKNISVGQKTGYVGKAGYVQIGFQNKLYFAHRLAWKMFYKENPPKYIDHIDRNPSNNAIANLREATNSQNISNSTQRKGKALKIKGVYYHAKTGKYFSSICVNYKQKYLGLFKTPEEAHAAYQKASAELHGEFSCPN